MGIAPIRSVSKAERVERALAEMILSGELVRGQLMPPEPALCEQLQVSRSVLREAMKMLASKGLVEIRQGRGTHVQRPKANIPEEALKVFLRTNSVSLVQLTEVRRPLELEICRLAAERRTEEHLDAMRETQKVLLDPGSDNQRCVQADTEFHQTLVKATGNALFSVITNALMDLLEASRSVTVPYFGVRRVHRQHGRILACVEAQDSKGAQKAMALHLDTALEGIRVCGKEEEEAPVGAP